MSKSKDVDAASDHVVVMQTFEMSWQRKRKEWQFPTERFITYEASDESSCRYFGIGKEVEVVETVTVPQAYVRSISQDGTMEIGAIASPSVTGVRSA